LIFTKNAKVGTSTVLLWMHRIHTGDHEFQPDLSIHFENDLPRHDEVGAGRLARMLSGGAFRFTFVRDPIRRAESAYVNKVVELADGRVSRRTRLQRTLDLVEDPDQVPTFDQFVTALELEDPIGMDAHWRPQHLNLMHPLVEHDLVGRLETFDADLARVRDIVGLPDVPYDVQNASRSHRHDSLFDGRPDLRRRVESVYARDFELYGY
jgi:hypothetical protein